MLCAHEVVVRMESLNPRLPLVEWRCAGCGCPFRIVQAPFRGQIERRRLRRQLAQWDVRRPRRSLWRWLRDLDSPRDSAGPSRHPDSPESAAFD